MQIRRLGDYPLSFLSIRKRGWKMENKIEKAILKRHGLDNFASETFHDIAGKVVKDLRDGSLRCETTKADFQLP